MLPSTSDHPRAAEQERRSLLGGPAPELSPPATQASQAVPLLCAARSGAGHGTKPEPARDPDATPGSRTGAAAVPGTGAAAQPPDPREERGRAWA